MLDLFARLASGGVGATVATLAVLVWGTSYPSFLVLPMFSWALMHMSLHTAMWAMPLLVIYATALVLAHYASCVYCLWAQPDGWAQLVAGHPSEAIDNL